MVDYNTHLTNIMEPIDEHSRNDFIEDSVVRHRIKGIDKTKEVTLDSISFHSLEDREGDEFFQSSDQEVQLEEIARDLESSLPVRNRRHKLRLYTNTFVGSDCVDYLVRAKFASSRVEAVELARRIANEFNLFEHVELDHELKDDNKFYRFIEPARRTTRLVTEGEDDFVKLEVNEDLVAMAELLREKVKVRNRTYRLRKYRQVFVASDAVTIMVEHGLASSRDEAVELGRRLQKEANLWHHVKRGHSFKDEYLFFRFSSLSGLSEDDAMSDIDGSVVSNISTSVSVLDMTPIQLHNVAEQLRRGLRVKDRTYHLKTFQSCFVASEAVDFMVEAKLARSRDEAVDLGRRLAKEFHLWHHVTNEHHFDDNYLFFRFADASDQTNVRESLSIAGDNSTESIGMRTSFRKSCFENESTTSESSSSSLSGVATKLVRGVQVKDRVYKLRTYRACFVGSEAVDFMVQARIVSSRDEAVLLGKQLQEECQLFDHVTKAHSFEDGYIFYRFSGKTDYSHKSEDLELGESDELMPSTAQPLGLDELVNIGEQMRKGVRIKNRQYRLKTYKNCFIGSEAVDYLVQSGLAFSRENAVEIGHRLSEELSFLQHVTNEHPFADDHLFFRFHAKERRTSTTETIVTLSGGRESFSAGFHADLSTNGPRLEIERNTSIHKQELLRLREIRKQIFEEQRVVLVGGPSGCGKSELIQHALLEDHRIMYGSAKFDRVCYVTQYQTLRLIFSDLCKRLRLSPLLQQYQRSLEQDFKDSRVQQAALSAWIPEAQALFYSNADDDTLNCRNDTMIIVRRSMELFLQSISRVTPVILILDDIMFSDCSTLEVLTGFFKQKMKNVLFCATFRENEISEGIPLLKWRKEIESVVSLETINLQDLAIDEVQDFLSNCLRREPEDVLDLSALILEKTHGNLFFLVHMLESMQDSSLLYYDYTRTQWTFNVKEIRSKTLVADNVGELLSSRIEQLPRDIQQLLKLAACYGSSFDPEILERTKSVLFVFEDIHQCLQQACEDEFLIRVSDREYIFSNDQIQVAAYNLLPKGNERKRIHWDIGRKLSKSRLQLGEDDSAWYFAVADQLSLSEDILLDEIKDRERGRIARVFLNAGTKASILSAFVPATTYFQKGIEVLGGTAEIAFSTNYYVAEKLFIGIAKAQLSAGMVEESRTSCESIKTYAHSEDVKRIANQTIFHCLAAENKLQERLDFGLELMEGLGHKLPSAPNRVQVTYETERSRLALKRYADSEILELPPISDKDIEFCIDILCDLVISGTAMGRVNFAGYGLAKLVQLTLQHGLCKFTPLILVLVGQDIIANFNDLREGSRFVNLGLDMEKQLGSSEGRGRLLAQSCFVLGCIEPLSKCMYIGLDAYKTSMIDGNVQNAFFGANAYLLHFFYSGLPFEPLLEDAEKFALQMLEYKQTLAFALTTPIIQLLRCLSGREENLVELSNGQVAQMNTVIENVDHKKLEKETMISHCMQISFYNGKIDKATECYEKIKDEDMGIAKASTVHHVRLFFFALVCIENFRKTSKYRFKAEAKKYIDILRGLLEEGAINLPHKVRLLDAEFSSLGSKGDQVLRQYDRAIVEASRAGFLQDGALSNYLCAQFHMRKRDALSAERYLIQAHDMYASWGALAVAESVKVRHPAVFPDSQPTSHSRSGHGFRSRTHFQSAISNVHKSLAKARSSKHL